MVRFKNRYFLLELLPFHLDAENETVVNNRYHTESVSSAIKIDSPSSNCLPPFTPASVSSCIRNSIALNYGQHASSSLLQSLSVKYSNTATNMVILRVPREFFAEIWTSLTFLTDWPAENPSLTKNLKCTWRSVHCAGTIRSCQRAAISFARKVMKDQSSTYQEILEPLAKKIRTIEP